MQRRAFTLIELLIVIAIIATLIGMILPAVQMARQRGKITQAASEISQLTTAVQNANVTQSSRYLPSSIFISKNMPLTGNSWYDLTQFYGPRLGVVAPPPVVSPSNCLPNLGQLNGNQCLVFFLGGYDGTNFTTGVSKDISNPFGPATGRGGIYFDFPVNRLYHLPGAGQSIVPVFLDPWGHPYYYFSSRGSGNDYDLYDKNPGGACSFPAGSYASYVNSLPANLPATSMAPLKDITGKFVNSTTCQIISGGKDGKPGPGGKWIAGQPPYNGGSDGFDDQSNFSTNTLGVP